MSAQPAKSVSAWSDEASHHPIIADKARRAEPFVTAMAGGKIDESQIKAQESRLVALMEEIEPQLGAALHAKVTNLLCELTVYTSCRRCTRSSKPAPRAYSADKDDSLCPVEKERVMAGQPKTPFYIVLALVVAGLVAFAVYRSDILRRRARRPVKAKIDARPARPEGRVAGHGGAPAHDRERIRLQARRSACRRSRASRPTSRWKTTPCGSP